jgi:class 3 adenylate cyclase
MGELPTGTVTLLFADMQGVMRRYVDSPASAKAAMQRHETIFCGAVAAHSGYVYTTMGDTCCAVFAHANDALGAALAAQGDLRAEATELRSYMGLHTGPVRLEGNQYAGPTVARIIGLMKAGYRGPVLLSEAAAEAVGDQLPPGAGLRPLGRHKLVDSAERELIFELVSPQLVAERPTRAMATILFTDVVESTSRAVAIGDHRWRQALEAHNQLARQHIAKFGGREIRSTGDGFCAVFSTPSAGIECACAMSDALARLGIDIRAGLHCGECEVAEDRINGIAVHIAARVVAEAGAREVIVSGTVKELVTGSEMTFEDRGGHSLKGIPGEWHLFAVKSR